MKKIFIILFILVFSVAAYGEKVEIQITDFMFIKQTSKVEPSKLLLKFELPEVLTNAQIDLAKLIIEIPPVESLNESLPIAIFPYHNTWSQSNEPMVLSNLNYSDSIASVTVLRPSVTVDAQVSYIDQHFDITRMVKDWLAGKYSNNGLIIMPSFENDRPLPISWNVLGNAMPEAKVIIYFTRPEVEIR